MYLSISSTVDAVENLNKRATHGQRQRIDGKKIVRILSRDMVLPGDKDATDRPTPSPTVSPTFKRVDKNPTPISPNAAPAQAPAQAPVLSPVKTPTVPLPPLTNGEIIGNDPVASGNIAAAPFIVAGACALALVAGIYAVREYVNKNTVEGDGPIGQEMAA